MPCDMAAKRSLVIRVLPGSSHLSTNPPTTAQHLTKNFSVSAPPICLKLDKRKFSYDPGSGSNWMELASQGSFGTILLRAGSNPDMLSSLHCQLIIKVFSNKPVLLLIIKNDIK